MAQNCSSSGIPVSGHPRPRRPARGRCHAIRPRAGWHAVGLAILIAAAVLAWSRLTLLAAVPSAKIVVTTTLVEPVSDEACGIVEAVEAANADSPYFGCPAGNGADTIVLSGMGYEFDTPYGDLSALPIITSPITIVGNDSTVRRTGGPAFRLIQVGGAAGDLILNAVTLTGGSAGVGGGLAAHDSSQVTLVRSTLTDNQAQTGGGLAAESGSTVVIRDSTISRNTASLGAGLSIRGDSTLSLENSTLFNNLGPGMGGGGGAAGLHLEYSSASLNHSTLAGNAAYYAGGLMAWQSTVTLANSLVAGNHATSDHGREIYGHLSTVTSLGTNVLGEAGETSAEGFVGFVPHSSDVVGTSDYESIPLDEMVETNSNGFPILDDNGGPTHTIALVSGSPAIDLVATAGCPAADQRGAPRPIDGDGLPSTHECDSGAFEFASDPIASSLFLPAAWR